MSANGSEPAARVCLVAHLAYYKHAAAALASAGLLESYLHDPALLRPLPGAGLPVLGPSIARINRTKVHPELRSIPGHDLWLGRAGALCVSRAGRLASPAARRGERGTGLSLQALLWDLDARRRVGTPDVLHFVSGIGELTARSARRRGARLVCDVRVAHARVHLATTAPALARRGIGYRLPNEANLARLEREYRLADLLVCCSEYSRRSFLDMGFDPDRVTSVPLGCDLAAFSPAPAPPARFTVLFAGRERLRKGFGDLGDAARALDPSCRLLVTGHPDRRSIEALAGVRAEVTFLGEVAHGAMPELYRSASVLALPSLSEGFGLVVSEAMASGLPVVVSDHTGAADLVRHGESGYVVPAGDVDAIADALVALEGDRDTAAAMGAAARRSAERHGWDTYRDELVATYRRWLDR